MSFGDKLAMQTLFGGRQDRPGRAFGSILARLDAPGACQDRLWGGFWASKTRPERVPERPWSGFERMKPPKIDFSTIFRRFYSIFRRFSDAFSSIFRTSFV